MAPTLNDLQNQLIEKFDMDYWNAKARMYAKLLEDKKLCEEVLQRKDPLDREFLLTELNATKIHCCETLIRLIIIAQFKISPLIPLMALKQNAYQQEIEKMTIQENNRTKKLTIEEREKEENEKLELYFKGKSQQYFKDNFFPLIAPPVAIESANFMKKCIVKILGELSKKSLYNVYKHGFYGNVSVQDNATLSHTSEKTGEKTTHKISHLIRGLSLIKERKKGTDHIVFLEDHAIEIMRERQIIDLASKLISNYYNMIRINNNKPIVGVIYEFKNSDDYIQSVFKFESFVKTFSVEYPFLMPPSIKKQFNIKI